MVLRAGEATGMETEDDCVKPKRSSRIVKPPRWHEDYMMTQLNPSMHPAGQLAHQPEDLSHLVASQGASITATQNEVKSLSEEIKQMKGMLLDVGHMMKDMQRKRSSSFSTGSECSSIQASPGHIPIQANQQDAIQQNEMNARDSIVDELSECMRRHQTKQDNVLSTPSKVQRQNTLPPSQYVPSTSSLRHRMGLSGSPSRGKEETFDRRSKETV